ncbi:CKLF-like MARVEL transmembrane domain-containing protein 7 [Amazona aestiva]|uniref:CKLF-like MARVEL transmembrane domain-containing protein 7 n=1 Tax=Amazona aestiva TaxID=12930 RepID=A0A0Q3X9M0_AMAAE|nr:CKLF-like MARVEL transmembrane domain-containing protein 7 [Amazona aestiva]
MSHGARVIRTGVSSAGPAAPPASTAASSSAGSDAELLDGAYFRSCAGILKVAQMISLVVGFISVNNSPWTDYSAYSYFQIVTMCDLVMILFFYIIHIFRIYRKLTCVSWPLAEFLHYLIGTILLLIASIVAASKSYNLTGLVAGATFGFLATILCVLSIWSSYKVSCITQSTKVTGCPQLATPEFVSVLPVPEPRVHQPWLVPWARTLVSPEQYDKYYY